MKKLLFLLSLTLMSVGTMAMSKSKVRTHARFLTDRMAYELDMTPTQYDDCYEINYDFIYAVRDIMDDVVYGYSDAITQYYTLLDYRNEDLRYVMTSAQYIRFLTCEYFYRPIYSTGSSWNFRIYTIYSNRTFFYFDAPPCYKTYAGAHSRTTAPGYFSTRYKSSKDRYSGNANLRGNNKYDQMRKSDFGTNMRDRQQTTYNNYKNTNANNRTQDNRYRDNSGNQNSPQINNRNQNGSSSKQNGNTQTTQKNNQTNTNNGNSGGKSNTANRGQGSSQTSGTIRGNNNQTQRSSGTRSTDTDRKATNNNSSSTTKAGHR